MNENGFRLAVFISGRGSNLEAIARAIAAHALPIEIVLVLSNTKKAKGLEFARNQGLRTVVVPRRSADLSEEEYDQALLDAVRPFHPDLIVLAGFMRVVGPKLIAAYRHRIINIHPSLLPSFRGLDVQQRALDAGVRFSGCSVHYVVEEVDAGPIIGQAVVPVLPGDTADILAARILRQEHRLLPAIVNGIAQGAIRTVEKEDRVCVEIDPDFLGTADSDAFVSIKPL